MVRLIAECSLSAGVMPSVSKAKVQVVGTLGGHVGVPSFLHRGRGSVRGAFVLYFYLFILKSSSLSFPEFWDYWYALQYSVVLFLFQQGRCVS